MDSRLNDMHLKVAKKLAKGATVAEFSIPIERDQPKMFRLSGDRRNWYNARILDELKDETILYEDNSITAYGNFWILNNS